MKNSKHKAPRLFYAWQIAAAGLILYEHARGKMPFTFGSSGPGFTHAFFACVIIGAWWGIRSGWGRRDGKESKSIDMAVAAGAMLGIEEMHELHKNNQHKSHGYSSNNKSSY